MIDITTDSAKAKLATLPETIRGAIELQARATGSAELAANIMAKDWLASEDPEERGLARLQQLSARLATAVLYVLIIEAFDPPNTTAQAARAARVERILGGDDG